MTNRILITKNFYLDELVDPWTYFNTHDSGLSLIDLSLPIILQLLRDKYGKAIYVNNWYKYYLFYRDEKPLDELIIEIEKSKSLNKWSGTRTTRCNIGASLSAHRTWSKGLAKKPYGQAIDPKSDTDAFYKIVKENLQEFYDAGLRRLEDPKITRGWLHMDTLERYTEKDSIRVIGRKYVTEILRFTR